MDFAGKWDRVPGGYVCLVVNLVTDRRMSMKEDVIEAMCLLRHWYKEEGVI